MSLVCILAVLAEWKDNLERIVVESNDQAMKVEPPLNCRLYLGVDFLERSMTLVQSKRRNCTRTWVSLLVERKELWTLTVAKMYEILS